jgi:hypothetical protein
MASGCSLKFVPVRSSYFFQAARKSAWKTGDWESALITKASWQVVVEVRVGVCPLPRYKSDIDNRSDERRQGAVESPTYTYCDRRRECPPSRWRFGQKNPMLQDERLRTRFKVICNSFASSRPEMRACELCLSSCPSYIRRPLIASSKLSSHCCREWAASHRYMMRHLQVKVHLRPPTFYGRFAFDEYQPLSAPPWSRDIPTEPPFEDAF